MVENKPRKKITPKSVEDITKRYDAIRDIQADYISRKVRLSRKILLEELKKKGFEPSASTLDRDLIEVAKGNPYVRNIAEATFSQKIEEMATALDSLEEIAWQWLDNPPQIIKQKMEPIGEPKNGKQQFKVIEQTVETMSKRAIAADIREIVMAKKDLITGDVLNVSIVLLGNKLNHQAEYIKKLEEEKAQQLQKTGKPVQLVKIDPEL